jgi:hypothetical protein
MSNSSVTEIKQKVIEKEHVNLCWKVSLPIQHLLDVISSILAEEYIMIAKQNPGVFLNNTPRLSAPCAYTELRKCSLTVNLRGCALSGQGADK